MAPPSTLSIHLSFFLVSFLSFNSAEGHPSPRPTCRVGCHEGEKIHIKSQECEFPPVKCIKGEILIQLEGTERWQLLKYMSYGEEMLVIQDVQLDAHSNTDFCASLHNFTPPNPSNEVDPEATTLKCGVHGDKFNNTVCDGSVFNISTGFPPCLINKCPSIEFHMMVKWPVSSDRRWWAEVAHLLDLGFALEWGHVPPADCLAGRNDSKHAFNSNAEPPSNCFTCSNYSKHAFNSNAEHQNDGKKNGAETPNNGSNHTERRKIKIIIGVCTGVGSCILTCLLFLFCFCYRKRRLGAASALLSRGMSSDPSSRSELGKEDLRLPTHVFSYEELEDATNNFDPSKELGDGGFGTVYHGRLQDGRSIAVKRLYENNYRRVEQFMNEIDILSRLRHPNLVTLYGCTSRHSRELLLVYEYIPNGTVADHLYGNRAKDGCLTWPIRMGIAIETADALSYLHAVDIIHRDVKTNNILLDSNFRVKVADFGLSRLFPMDKTHVSTAPQGTPGYVDPDYHRCYQLNDKSDVYSFGVVLIELISSKPAVDITRHRHEINLANMAINKIHNRALHEMVDPTLGFETDHAVMRMITLVSELAFRCLQDEKEVRPSMYEVLKFLKGIENEDYKVEKGAEMDVQAPDDAVLLNRKMPPTSPDSVTNVWTSRSTTPNASGSKCFPLVVV